MKTFLNRRAVMFLLLAGFLLGTVFTVGVAFSPLTARAQSGDGESAETTDTDDANEGPAVPITGSALDQASAAALAYLGEGTVTDSEVGDEEGYYEIEITRDNGREVDVHLDENFNVLGHEDD
jgi:uncharacterized membrane protein YkoI